MSAGRRFLNSGPGPNGSARLDRGGAPLAALSEKMPTYKLPKIVVVQDGGGGRRRLGWCQNVCVCICLTLIARRYNIREFRIRIKNPDVLIEYRGARICGPDTKKPRPLRDVDILAERKRHHHADANCWQPTKSGKTVPSRQMRSRGACAFPLRPVGVNG